VLLAKLRDCLLPSPRVNRYRENRPFGCCPVTHLVRSGRSQDPAGLACLSGSSLARPATLDCRRFSRALAPTYPGSRHASSCVCVQPNSERLQAAAPFRPGADSSEPAMLRWTAVRVPAYPGPAAKLPRVIGLRPPSPLPGPRPARASSTAQSGPPEPEADPDPGPRLLHRGLPALANKTVFVAYLGFELGI
jgi:hypothetical protein